MLYPRLTEVRIIVTVISIITIVRRMTTLFTEVITCPVSSRPSTGASAPWHWETSEDTSTWPIRRSSAWALPWMPHLGCDVGGEMERCCWGSEWNDIWVIYIYNKHISRFITYSRTCFNMDDAMKYSLRYNCHPTPLVLLQFAHENHDRLYIVRQHWVFMGHQGASEADLPGHSDRAGLQQMGWHDQMLNVHVGFKTFNSMYEICWNISIGF